MVEFAQVTFTEDASVHTGGDELTFEEGKSYELPYDKAVKMRDFGGLPIEVGEAYDVDEDDVADRFGQEVDDEAGVSDEDSPENDDDEEPEDDEMPEEPDDDNYEDPEYCQAEKSNGEVCGRERPCQYHDE